MQRHTQTKPITADSRTTPYFSGSDFPTALLPRKYDHETSQGDIGQLVSRYSPALTAYLKRRFSLTQEGARKALNEFVKENVVKRNLLEKIRPTKGHQFRRFLLTSLHTFANNQYKGQIGLRGKTVNGISSFLQVGHNETVVTRGPECRDFDLDWAKSVLKEALKRMEEECRLTNRLHIWNVFDKRIRKPLLLGAPMQSYTELVREFGFKSPAQAHNVIVAAKRCFAMALEEVVREYAIDPEVISQEIRELQIILMNN